MSMIVTVPYAAWRKHVDPHRETAEGLDSVVAGSQRNIVTVARNVIEKEPSQSDPRRPG
jgi:hypothetical protein